MINHRKGLSLIEVVMAIGIILIVFFSIYETLILGFRYYGSVRTGKTLANLGQMKMEEIFANAAKGTNIVSEEKNFNAPYTAYKYKLDVNDIPISETGENSQKYSVKALKLTVEGPFSGNGTTKSRYYNNLILYGTAVPKLNVTTTQHIGEKEDSSLGVMIKSNI